MTQTTPSSVDAMREAIHTIIARMEAIEDAASDALAGDLTEHAAGYYRGEKATAKALRAHLHDMTRAALSTLPSDGVTIPAGMRLVPQAWIDRSMQIEARADDLVSGINDAIQRAQEGSGRLYAANNAVLDDRIMRVLEAIAVDEPSFAAAPKTPPVAQAEGVQKLIDAARPFAWCAKLLVDHADEEWVEPDSGAVFQAGNFRALAAAIAALSATTEQGEGERPDEIEWEGTEAQQLRERMTACRERRAQWGDDCPGNGSCEECETDMALALETDTSRARRLAARARKESDR